jgi:hypothetical protein
MNGMIGSFGTLSTPSFMVMVDAERSDCTEAGACNFTRWRALTAPLWRSKVANMLLRRENELPAERKRGLMA